MNFLSSIETDIFFKEHQNGKLTPFVNVAIAAQALFSGEQTAPPVSLIVCMDIEMLDGVVEQLGLMRVKMEELREKWAAAHAAAPVAIRPKGKAKSH